MGTNTVQKILTILAMGLVVLSWSATRRTSTIAVLPLLDANTAAKENGLGQVVSSMLGTHLRNETNFMVLERSNLNRLIDEKQYIDVGLTKETRDKLKQMHSVEVLLTGEVSELAGLIQLDLRLISVESGEVVVAEYGSVKSPDALRSVVSRLAKTIEDKYLRQWMGNLNILVHPIEGEVYLDNQFVGKSSPQVPLNLSNLLEGEYQLKILAGGYQPFEQSITVKPRTVREIQPALLSLPGSLLINSEPKGATVFLNGKQMGVTPLKVDTLIEGGYMLNMSLKNFKPWSQRVRISSGQLSEVTGKLEVIPGSVLVNTSPEGAQVYVGRSLMGKAPLLLENVTPGTTSIELRLEGYATHSEDLVIKPGERDTLSPMLRRETGKLTLVSALDQVTATITGPMAVKKILPFHKETLDAGTYEVKLSKDKYFTVTKQIEVSPDQETRLEVNLKRKPGKLVIADASETPVDVFVDGIYKGKAGGLAVNLDEGPHDVFLRNWHGEKRIQIQVVADETIEIPAASLKVDRSLPWWSALGALVISGMILITTGVNHD